MSEFESLLADLQSVATDNEQLAKALPNDDADDKKVEGAAEEAGAADTDPAAGEPDDDSEPMAKSLDIDGENYQIVDAEPLLKALGDRMTETEITLAKALQSTVAALKDQSELIKSLQLQVNKLGSQGAGRKTVLTVLEKPATVPSTPAETLAKSQSQEGITTGEFFAKAESLFESKKLTGMELTTISVSLREKQPIDQKLISKVLNTNV